MLLSPLRKKRDELYCILRDDEVPDEILDDCCRGKTDRFKDEYYNEDDGWPSVHNHPSSMTTDHYGDFHATCVSIAREELAVYKKTMNAAQL